MTISRFSSMASWFGVVILAMALAAQPAFAQEDDDDDDGAAPLITDVFVDEGAGELVIVGEGFMPSFEDPVVTLGDDPLPLALVSASDTVIVATLPAGVEVGDHLLTVATGSGGGDDDDSDSDSDGGSVAWNLTFGAVGPQGIQGVKGDTGEQGIQGGKGDTGDQGIQGAKGDTGEQGIQGEQGKLGPPGDLGSLVVTRRSGPLVQFQAIDTELSSRAVCLVGEVVTGGGWTGSRGGGTGHPHFYYNGPAFNTTEKAYPRGSGGTIS